MTTLTTQRTLSAPIAGPVVFALDMPHGQIDVRVGDIDRAEIDLSTPAPDGSPAARAVADATLTAEVRKITVRVPTPDGGTTIVSRGGRMVVQNFGHVSAGTTITGITISGDGSVHIGGGVNATPGVRAVVRLPRGSALAVHTKTGEVTTSGELEWTQFASVSGSLRIDACGKLSASSTSGDVSADYADEAEVRTVSGDIRLGRTDSATAGSTSGDISIGDFGGSARLRTISGDITVHATEPGHVTANSTSGDIRVTAPAELAAATGENALTVDARSVSGDVRTPRPIAGPARPRRPAAPLTNRRSVVNTVFLLLWPWLAFLAAIALGSLLWRR
ncbi:DUF4097 family beta strand repeat-containing protein [Nonomuraea aurantiaca]|uniref:DUF4097 family beta strand repeat-containing protein n=1 Tax=Nonomuraea aurantiaca TaxID=2878562 RepID=UPI001CD99ED4|nr:DUF4097 family beta strand repeat-containing protein [Nonomuraea aurantiaca]MCA2227391.1 DUF4097 domain-containing protein [Nonomuraea aurantiaca]